MSFTEAQNDEVRATLHAYAAAYQKKDFRELLTLFSPEISGFGSGPDEIIRNHRDFVRQIRRDMSQATVNGVDFTETKIFGEGRVAWIMTKTAIRFTIPGLAKQTLHGRSTMVLRNTGSRWVIEQIHFSLPYGEQAPGQSFPGA